MSDVYETTCDPDDEFGRNWSADVWNMHRKFGVHGVVDARASDREWLGQFLEFRLRCLHEEIGEVEAAVNAGDAEGVVDGLIDMCVFAIGTLDAFNVDARLAWRRVMDANGRKTPGVKPERPNPLGLPDLVKDADWAPPTHDDNVGLIPDALAGIGTATKAVS